MAFAVERPARQGPAATVFLCRLLTFIWNVYRAWSARQRSLAVLRDLPPHLLDDVGLTPADQMRGRPARNSRD